MVRHNHPRHSAARKPRNGLLPIDVRSSLAHGEAVRIQCDRVRLNVIVADDAPCWAMKAIAERTRIPLAVRLVASRPDTTDFVQLLHDVMKSLGNCADGRRARGNAIPTKVCVDNGPEFRSRAFADACHELGLTITHTVP